MADLTVAELTAKVAVLQSRLDRVVTALNALVAETQNYGMTLAFALHVLASEDRITTKENGNQSFLDRPSCS